MSRLARSLGAIATAVALAGCETTAPAPVAPPTVSIAALYQRPAERALVNGLRLYEEGAFDRAETAFRTALSQGLADSRDVATAHKYLAFLACAFNRLAECERHFRDGFGADARFSLADSEIGHPVWGPIFRRVAAEQPKK